MLNRAKTAEERLLEKELQWKDTLFEKVMCLLLSWYSSLLHNTLGPTDRTTDPGSQKRNRQENPTDNKHVAELVFARVQLFTTRARS